jgi:hypothetical protein
MFRGVSNDNMWCASKYMKVPDRRSQPFDLPLDLSIFLTFLTFHHGEVEILKHQNLRNTVISHLTSSLNPRYSESETTVVNSCQSCLPLYYVI